MIKEHYCIKCNKNKISLQNFRYGQKTCRRCSKLGIKRPEIGKRYKGENNPFFGKHHKPKTIEKIKNKLKGSNCYSYVDGRSLKSKYCYDCGKEITWTAKRCQNCETFRRISIDFWKISPNKTELRLNKILQEFFPNKYRLNVAGEVTINNKIPDFIDIENKKIIELFGDYWHSKKVTGRNKKQEELNRINYFKKYRYKTLIIWEHELENIKILKNKLIKFNKIIEEE